MTARDLLAFTASPRSGKAGPLDPAAHPCEARPGLASPAVMSDHHRRVSPLNVLLLSHDSGAVCYHHVVVVRDMNALRGELDEDDYHLHGTGSGNKHVCGWCHGVRLNDNFTLRAVPTQTCRLSSPPQSCPGLGASRSVEEGFLLGLQDPLPSLWSAFRLNPECR